MGAKIPGRLKTRRPTCKCDVCGSGFLNIQALRSHQACVHPRSTKRVAYKPKIEVIARRKLVPAKKPIKTATMKGKVRFSVDKPKVGVKKSVDNKPYNTRRIEFECPVCSKIFTVYFSAYRHIQKHHCINEEGEPVSPNSSDLIQPTRIELCMSCNKRVASNQTHSCINAETESMRYSCLGCEETFTTMNAFEVHIPSAHSDEADNFVFPDMDTYTAWREDMETQTELKYSLLSKKGNAQTYHCGHFTTENKTTHYCPSSFKIQEQAKDVLVANFQEHFGHETKIYKIPEIYKKYLVTNSEMVTKGKDTDDVYGQFKNVMNDIITSSEKIDVNGLKVLLDKAMEMSSVLKKYEEPLPVDPNKSITDDEITKLLDKPLRKRKMETSEDSISKRLRKDSISQKSDDVKEEKLVKELKTYSNVKKTPLKVEDKKSETASPTSFNDSYKNFVDASYKITVEETNMKPKVDKKKEVVKTKVGQFKPNVSPKENVKPQNKAVKPNIIKQREIKIKEFHFPKFKPDFEYEVREQEDDCNILIIKI